MTASKLKSGLLVAVLVPFLMACPKPTKNVAPVPDQELQSSIDVSFANLVVTDIDMICSFMGEDDLSLDFYENAPNEKGYIPPYRNTQDEKIGVSFTGVTCIDGHVRDGSIILHYGNVNPNAKYYRDYEFKGRVEMDSYMIDGWKINTVAGTTCYLYNQLSSPAYEPSKMNLSWLIEGSFEFIHPTDPSKNMVWTGKLTKTLVNTSDPKVFDKSKQKSINWALARVEYRGVAKGFTSGNEPFTMTINEVKPLTRDFTCYPDAVSGITSVQPLKTWKKESHPFKSGILYLNTGNKYQRQIFYGNENNPQLEEQCDHSGQVLIKGNSYRIDFMN